MEMRYVVPVIVGWPGSAIAVNVGGRDFDGIFLAGVVAVLIASLSSAIDSPS